MRLYRILIRIANFEENKLNICKVLYLCKTNIRYNKFYHQLFVSSYFIN